MYTVEFYEDTNGNSEVRDYMERLVQHSLTDKNARINKNKIFTYIKALQEYGTRVGSPFVLLHHFIKKTQKTPKKEIETAIRNMKDWIERNEK